MVERRDIAGWLEGPGRAQGEPGSYAGQRLGLPPAGPGSAASFGRRLAALFLDWVACLVIARAFFDSEWAPLLVFTVANAVLLCTLGATFGMRLLGLRVVTLASGRTPLPLPAVVRSVLLALVVPALVWNSDGRGLHDRAAGTVVLRAR